MSNTLRRSGSTYTIPAVPYQPARPAYTETTTVLGYRQGPPNTTRGAWVTTRNPTTGQTSTVWDADYPANQPTSVPYYYTVTVTRPATPEVLGSGAQRIDRPPAGWTSFARSNAFVFDEGELTFTADPNVAGVVVGLSHNPAPVIGYSHIPHGLLVSAGDIRDVSTGDALGTYTATDVLGLEVSGGDVSYTKNGTEIGTGTSTYDADQALFMSAVMYGAGDVIDNPTLEQIGTADPEEGEISSDAVMGALRAFSADEDGIHSVAVMQPLGAQSYSGTLEVELGNESAAQLAPITGASLVLVGGLINSTAGFRPLGALSADYPYIDSRAVLAPLGAYSYQRDDTQAFVLEVMEFDVPLRATTINRADMRDSLAFDVPMSTTPSAKASMLEYFAFGVPMSVAGGVNEAAMPESIVFDVPMSVPGASLEVHSVNLDGFGSTTYTGYAFTSFACIAGRYYGTKDGGLYLLDGETDDGAPIQAAICPGKLDFGTSQNKTVVEAWLGVRSGSALACKLNAEGHEYLYRAESFNDEELEQHRIKFGKGLKANYITPVFYNQDGEDFEVDALEFAIATLSRKY